MNFKRLDSFFKNFKNFKVTVSILRDVDYESEVKKNLNNKKYVDLHFLNHILF